MAPVQRRLTDWSEKLHLHVQKHGVAYVALNNIHVKCSSPWALNRDRSVGTAIFLCKLRLCLQEKHTCVVCFGSVFV